MAAPDLRFHFVGDTPLGADLRGPAEFEEWFAPLYRNQVVQWVRLRWGRMTFDEVLEDTKALDAACHRQDLAVQNRLDSSPTTFAAD